MTYSLCDNMLDGQQLRWGIVNLGYVVWNSEADIPPPNTHVPEPSWTSAGQSLCQRAVMSLIHNMRG